MSSTTYQTWTTKDGQKIDVVDMTNTHLIHTIRAILEKRLLTKDRQRRVRWLMVLKGEAVKRGLRWDVPPTEKISLIDLVRRLVEQGYDFRSAEEHLIKSGIEIPEVDIERDTVRPTYMHYLLMPGVGAPAGEAAKQRSKVANDRAVEALKMPPFMPDEVWRDQMQEAVKDILGVDDDEMEEWTYHTPGNKY